MPTPDLHLLAALPQDFAQLRLGGPWRGFSIPEGGLEADATLAMLEGWSARLHAAQGWGHWLAMSGGEVVASLAVKEPPQLGTVEFGYATAPARRGRGIATAAVLALLPLLRGHGVATVVAETARSNPASGRVLQKAGFTQTGQRDDPDDGPLIEWRATL